jgi:hypothetical protein
LKYLRWWVQGTLPSSHLIHNFEAGLKNYLFVLWIWMHLNAFECIWMNLHEFVWICMNLYEFWMNFEWILNEFEWMKAFVSLWKSDGPGILARGLFLVGATWDEERKLLVSFFFKFAWIVVLGSRSFSATILNYHPESKSCNLRCQRWCHQTTPLETSFYYTHDCL